MKVEEPALRKNEITTICVCCSACVEKARCGGFKIPLNAASALRGHSRSSDPLMCLEVTR